LKENYNFTFFNFVNRQIKNSALVCSEKGFWQQA
jgi:hypothetical protein